jgi:hypothetical protein
MLQEGPALAATTQLAHRSTAWGEIGSKTIGVVAMHLKFEPV